MVTFPITSTTVSMVPFAHAYHSKSFGRPAERLDSEKNSNDAACGRKYASYLFPLSLYLYLTVRP